MESNNISRGGFTKIGFSKSGFGCCGHYSFCQMGRSTCFYEVSDPEAKSYCAAFNRIQATKQVESIKPPLPIDKPVSELIELQEEQLSLF